MTLIALTRTSDIEYAFNVLSQSLKAGGVPFERSVDTKAESRQLTVCWHADKKYWVSLTLGKAENHECTLGVSDPSDVESLAVTCEINMASTGANRTAGGLFVRSDNGTIYLAHSGGVGGGRPGNGKVPFLKFYGDETVDTVLWPDSKEWDYIIISALDDDGIKSHVGEFVHKVSEFRTATAPVKK